MSATACPLCDTPGGQIIHTSADWRLIVADEPGYPCWLRLIWREHVAEMSQLTPAQRQAVWATLDLIERVVLTELAPDKINLASFGNWVPHLHWHIIARWRDDRHFPQPAWGPPQAADEGRACAERLQAQREPLVLALRRALAAV